LVIGGVSKELSSSSGSMFGIDLLFFLQPPLGILLVVLDGMVVDIW